MNKNYHPSRRQADVKTDRIPSKSVFLLYAFGWLFYEGDMSPWVLSGIHIQLLDPGGRGRGGGCGGTSLDSTCWDVRSIHTISLDPLLCSTFQCVREFYIVRNGKPE
jgi:hypothetical protein